MYSKTHTFLTIVVSLGSTLAFLASGPSLESPEGFTILGFSLHRGGGGGGGGGGWRRRWRWRVEEEGRQVIKVPRVGLWFEHGNRVHQRVLISFLIGYL